MVTFIKHLRLYKEKGKLSSAFKKADTSAAYLYNSMNFIPALAIRFRIANSCTKWRGVFKGLSEDGDGRFF
jgi:hypothetical protein